MSFIGVLQIQIRSSPSEGCVRPPDPSHPAPACRCRRYSKLAVGVEGGVAMNVIFSRKMTLHHASTPQQQLICSNSGCLEILGEPRRQCKYRVRRQRKLLVLRRSFLDVIDHENGIGTFGFFEFETELAVDGVEERQGAVGVGAVDRVARGGQDLVGGAEA